MQCKFKDRYSGMTWLDEVRRETGGPTREIPTKTEIYYKTLERIRFAQDNGIASDALYAALPDYVHHAPSPEFGYYMANIHYDLFANVDVVTMEDRILYFLEKADGATLCNRGDFLTNFLFEFASYLKRISSGLERDREPRAWIQEHGDAKAQEILNVVGRLQTRSEK